MTQNQKLCFHNLDCPSQLKMSAKELDNNSQYTCLEIELSRM